MSTSAGTAEETFDHRGEVRSLNDMPVQRPHPPEYVAAPGADSVVRVGCNNRNLLIGQEDSQVQVPKQAEFYRDALAEAEMEYAPERVVAARAMYGAPTAEQARR